MSPPRRLIWDGTERLRLSEMLEKANGPRTSRTLTLDDVRGIIDRALASTTGFAWAHGGEVDDARALTTVCLVGVRAQSVTVGISVVHAKGVIPSWGWADMIDWERSSDSANSARVSAWAARKSEDRTVLALEPLPRATASLESLLESVRANPDDDAPRLVYADALTDRGDPRGEFIALQCAAGRFEERENELLTENLASWLEGVPASVECRFTRGFVDQITVPDTAALKSLEPFVNLEPVTRLILGADGLRASTPIRWVERLESIEFRDERWAMANDLLRFFDSRVFGSLAELAFTNSSIAPSSTNALKFALAASTPRLSQLGFRRSITQAGLVELISAPWFNALLGLDLADNDLRLAGISAFVGSAVKCKLQSLNLDGNHLGDEGASAIARSSRLSKLKVLSLARNRIGLRGADELMASPFLKNLIQLNLDNNSIGSKAKERVAARFGEH